MIDTKLTLFDGRAGEDSAQVWLEPDGAGVTLRTQEWGPGVERNFGWDTIETWLRIDGPALFTLAFALVADHPELDPTASPMEILAAAYRGDSAASAHLRMRLDELGLAREFTMR
ncbi:MAG: hypothetical protein H0W98_08875 [Chloroflexi bacterium]|nr:hypothetical protein [Chloroflexota bacterium]MBA3741241.1 hypothetical protein [Chloroflexota bacterium]